MASHWGHENPELGRISSFSVEWNGGSVMKPGLFSQSLQEAMNETGIKTQEAGACFQSPGKQFQLQNPCTSSEVLETVIQSGWGLLPDLSLEPGHLEAVWGGGRNTNYIQADLGLNPGFDTY